MPDGHPWQIELQQRLREVLYTFFQTNWPSDSKDWYLSDKGFVADFADAAFMLQEIEVMQIERIGPFTRLYAKVIVPDVRTVREVHNLVHRVFSLVDEGFFVLIPMHDEDSLRFWYMTGTQSHGHEGMVLINRSDIPFLTE